MKSIACIILLFFAVSFLSAESGTSTEKAPVVAAEAQSTPENGEKKTEEPRKAQEVPQGTVETPVENVAPPPAAAEAKPAKTSTITFGAKKGTETKPAEPERPKLLAPTINKFKTPLNLDIVADSYNFKGGFFYGEISAENKSSALALLEVFVEPPGSGGGRSYSKSISIPPGKTAKFNVFPPSKNRKGGSGYGSYGNMSVKIRQPRTEDISWTYYECGNRTRYYSGSADQIPYYSPSNLKQIPQDYLFFFSIPAMELKYDDWMALSPEVKDMISDWAAIGGSLNITGGHKLEIGKDIKAPFMDFPGGNYGAGNIYLDLKMTKENPGSLTRLSNEYSIAPSWDIKPVKPWLLIPAVVIFTLLIGPGAVIFARKLKNPSLLLFFIPAVSITACLCIVILTLFQDGVKVKLCPQVISYLDQKLGKVFTQQVLSLEAPIGLGSGIVFPEKALIIIPEDDSTGGICIAENGKMMLSGFVRPRIPTSFSMQKIEKRREMISVDEAGSSVKVTNALGARIEKILLKDSKGNLWKNSTPIMPGKIGELSPAVENPDETKQFYAYNVEFLLNGTRLDGKLRNSSYQVFLDRNVFGDIGYEGDRLVGNHYNLLIGKY